MHQPQNGNEIIEWWRVKYSWWENDFYFEYKTLKFLTGLLRKHPDDETGRIIRMIIKSEENYIKYLKKEYKNIYGANFNTNDIKNKLGL